MTEGLQNVVLVELSSNVDVWVRWDGVGLDTLFSFWWRRSVSLKENRDIVINTWWTDQAELLTFLEAFAWIDQGRHQNVLGSQVKGFL